MRKIIISDGKIKRYLPRGCFEICGSKEDLQSFAREILNITEGDFVYGWVKVCGLEPLGNVKPSEWDEPCA